MEHHPTAALHRVLSLLLVPLVLGAGVAAAHGGAERVWGLSVLLAVLLAGAVVLVRGLRDLVREGRARRPDAANGWLAASTRPNAPVAPAPRSPAGRSGAG